MKNLIFINGNMGIGKTAVSNELNTILENCVFLDGDWCLNMSPFIVTEKTKAMIIENIAFLLNNFLSYENFDNIVFCWVMHHQFIIDDILKRLDLNGFKLSVFTLTADDDTLISRLTSRMKQENKSDAQINEKIKQSLEYATLYKDINSTKIATEGKSPLEIATTIKALL